MELNQVITGEYKDSPVTIEYVADLPRTFEDHNHFMTDRELNDLMSYLECEKILRPEEINEFRTGDIKRGYMFRDGVYWETIAFYCSLIELYHIVRYETVVSKILTERNKTKGILFRFHSGESVFESIKHCFNIRDGKELANVIRARGFEFKELIVKPYAYDSRINWLTYLVVIDGSAIGYTNQSVYTGE